MKKIFSLIILSILCIAPIHAEITWTFVGNTLTISGTGEVDNTPWKHLKFEIKNVVINNGVTSIGNSAFSGCQNLENIFIPNSITSIGDYAFYGCKNLSNVTISNSVTSIGYYTFADCTGLTSIFIPQSVEKINLCAFVGCTSITSIIVDKENEYYDSRNNCNAIICKEDNTLVQGCKNTVIPNSVTSIGDYAFKDCKYLTSITIPYGVTGIGQNAFQGCSGLSYINIPSSVTYVSGAFEDCYMLPDKFVNNSDCDCAFTVIDIEQEDGLLIKGDKVVKCRPWATSVKTPNCITSICSGAFYGCTRLTSIELSNSLTTIEGSAFRECYNLSSFTIPNSVTSIGSDAFMDCSSLTSIYIPKNVENIGSGAFSGCSNLISIAVDEDNSYYDSRNNCNALIRKKDNVLINGCRNTIIPNGVKEIGYCAFLRCNGLNSIIIPNSVSRIITSAFYECHDLTSITIPNTVTLIAFGAFAACANLKDATIYVNKDLLIDDIFYNSGIEKLVMYGEYLPAYTSNMQSVQYDMITLHVPSALYDEYCSTSPWSKFKNIVKLPDEPINLVDGETFTNEKERNGQKISYTRTFNHTKWQALYIPFSMSYEDWKNDFDIAYINGIRQYDMNDDGSIDETVMDVIKIKKGSLIPNTPYLIRAKTIGEKTFTVNNATLYKAEENSIDCRTTIAEYTFTGNYITIPASTLIANNYYAMGGGSLVITDGTNGLNPYRWYMKIDSRSPMYNVSNGAKAITINVIGEEETTGVCQLRMTNDELPVYDLNGRKVNESALKPGLYIKNGKKIIIK